MRLALLGRLLPAEDDIRLRQTVFPVVAFDVFAHGVRDDGNSSARFFVPLQNLTDAGIGHWYARAYPVLPEAELAFNLFLRKAELAGKQRHDAGVKILAEVLLQRIRCLRTYKL